MGTQWLDFFSSAHADSGPADAAVPSYALVPRFSPDREIVVGDTLDFSIEGMSYSAEAKLKAHDALGEEAIRKAGWTVLEVLSPKPDDAPGTSAWVLKVAPIRGGDVTLPELLVTIEGAVGSEAGSVVARTRPYSTKVKSVTKNQQETIPPRPPVDLAPPRWLAFGIAAACVLTLALVIYAIYRGVKKWRGRRLPVVADLATVPELAPGPWALGRLHSLAQEKLAEKGEFKTHYFGVSDTLKSYVSRRFGFDAEEMTTAELLRELRTDDQAFVGLKKIFTQLDQVKFTDLRPVTEDATQVLVEAVTWVQEREKIFEEREAAERRRIAEAAAQATASVPSSHASKDASGGSKS